MADNEDGKLSYTFGPEAHVGTPLQIPRYYSLRFVTSQMPGTPEAIAAGCKCAPPSEDQPPNTWLVSADCEIHCRVSDTPDEPEPPDTLLERARQTVADGVGCDRLCENEDFCGCRADGEAVISMALEAVEKAVRTTLDEHGDPLATERAMRAIRGVIKDPAGTTG